jgi:hypothetical protein
LLDEATLTIRQDVACIGCGYNLRTLALEAKCPECARPVVDSLARNELHLADVKWLRRVRSGVVIVFIGLIGKFGVLFTNGIFTLGNAWSSAQGNSLQMLLCIYWSLSLGSAVALLVGVIRITTRVQSGGILNGSHMVNIFGVVFTLAALAFEIPYITFAAWTWTKPSLATALIAIERTVIPASFVCTSICLRRLALLAKQKTLVRSTSTLIGLLSLAGCLSVFGIVYWSYTAWFSGVKSSTVWNGVAGNAVIGAAVVYLISFVIGIILLNGYRRMLSDAIAESERRAAA